MRFMLAITVGAVIGGSIGAWAGHRMTEPIPLEVVCDDGTVFEAFEEPYARRATCLASFTRGTDGQPAGVPVNVILLD